MSVIPFREFAEGMKEHWPGDPAHTPVYNNPFGIYFYDEPHKDTILFPVKYTIDGEDAAFSSVSNISHTHLRTRGIYVVPKFRGLGLGYRLMRESWELFPKSFNIGVEFFKEEVAEKFVKRGMKFVQTLARPNRYWSDYSGCWLYLLYEKRYTERGNLRDSYDFISENQEKFSLGGTNNLNVRWGNKKWSEYFRQHSGNYAQNPYILEDLVNLHYEK